MLLQVNEGKFDRKIVLTGANIARSDNRYMWAATLSGFLIVLNHPVRGKCLRTSIKCRKGKGDLSNLEWITSIMSQNGSKTSSLDIAIPMGNAPKGKASRDRWSGCLPTATNLSDPALGPHLHLIWLNSRWRAILCILRLLAWNSAHYSIWNLGSPLHNLGNGRLQLISISKRRHRSVSPLGASYHDYFNYSISI